ncbi:MAG: hypothetical protein EXR47_05865 [Dehalococcoidia bacterium]|nr:hypothetical protein [Dehalococcoidia bacterium]
MREALAHTEELDQQPPHLPHGRRAGAGGKVGKEKMTHPDPLSLEHLLAFVNRVASRAKRIPKSDEERLEQLEDEFRGYLNAAIFLRPQDAFLLNFGLSKFDGYEEEYKDWLVDLVEKFKLRLKQLAEGTKTISDQPSRQTSSSINIFVPNQNKPNRNPMPPREQVFPAGTPLDAYKAFRDIIQSARTSILLVDNFVDSDIVELLISAKRNCRYSSLDSSNPGGLQSASQAPPATEVSRPSSRQS